MNKAIDFKKLTITAFTFGFVLIPIHELGHVICDWLTGHPATMSYARDRLLSGGETPFLLLLLVVRASLTPEVQVRADNEDHHHHGSHYFPGPPTGAGPSLVFSRSGGEGQALDLRLIRRRGQVAYPHHHHR